MKFFSALCWIVLGLCIGTGLSRIASGLSAATRQAYAPHHVIATAASAATSSAQESDRLSSD